jgi:hypothetical protein
MLNIFWKNFLGIYTYGFLQALQNTGKLRTKQSKYHPKSIDRTPAIGKINFLSKTDRSGHFKGLSVYLRFI